ncbi:MAG: type 4a pilus biogenesis protein PilO [Acidobacteriaceae bacterium]|jgi:hypothetical protein|nr:type 4a pilus biogenesis protein PilO [Acidobacteriaceae bacterium]
MTRALLTRIAAERRVPLVVIGTILAGNLLAFFLVVRPLMQQSTGAAHRAEVAAHARADAERELAQAKQLVAGAEDAQQALAAFYTKVLPPDLVGARRMTYAKLPALADKSGVTYTRRTMDLAAPKKDEHLTEMKIRMQLHGEYANLRAFIDALERAPEFLVINDIALTDANGSGELTLTINLSTYVRQAAHGS